MRYRNQRCTEMAPHWAIYNPSNQVDVAHESKQHLSDGMTEQSVCVFCERWLI